MFGVSEVVLDRHLAEQRGDLTDEQKLANLIASKVNYLHEEVPSDIAAKARMGALATGVVIGLPVLIGHYAGETEQGLMAGLGIAAVALGGLALGLLAEKRHQ